MAKFCRNCGNELESDVKFCNHCGTPVDETVPTNNQSNGNYTKLQEKNIATNIILSIITCGIYGIIWFIQMNDDANLISDDNNKTSGGMALLLTIVTCGIYYIYWSYMMGQKLYNAGQKYNKNIADNSVVYLILSIFGLGIVSECLIQNDLNKFAD